MQAIFDSGTIPENTTLHVVTTIDNNWNESHLFIMYVTKRSCQTRFFFLCKLTGRQTNLVLCVNLAYTS